MSSETKSTNGWQYVGKQKNRHQSNSKKANVDKKKVNQVQSLYEPEIRAKKQEPNSKPAVKKANKLADKKNGQQQKKKATNVNETVKRLTFEQSIQKIDEAQLKNLLENTQTHFPNDPIIWIKDFAYYISSVVQNETKDPIFSNYPINFPISLLKNGCLKIILNMLNKCEKRILQILQMDCVIDLIRSMARGTPTSGFRIMIQALSRMYPDLTVSNLKRLKDERDSHKNKPNMCLAILWCASQVGIYHPKEGFDIWLNLMLPIAGSKHYSSFIIDHLDYLMRISVSKVAPNKQTIDIRQFFPILDFVFTTNGLTHNLQKKLQSSFSLLRNSIMQFKPEENLRNFFPSYLCRLTSSISNDFRKELLSDIVKCLQTDEQCFVLWQKLYSENLTQSIILLKHLNIDWPILRGFNSKKLEETIKIFKVYNMNDKTANNNTIERLNYHCDANLKKLKKSYSFIKLLFFSTLIPLFYIIYDIKTSDKFEKSFYDFLDKYSKKNILLLDTNMAFFIKKLHYEKEAQELLNLLEIKSTYYYQKANELMEPYLKKILSATVHMSEHIWEHSEPIRNWLVQNAEPLLERYRNDIQPELLKIVRFISIEATKHFNLIKNQTLLLSSEMLVWMETNVLSGPLSLENLGILDIIDSAKGCLEELYKKLL